MKKIMLLTCMMLLLVGMVSAAKSIDIVETSISETQSAGQTVSFTINIENNGDEDTENITIADFILSGPQGNTLSFSGENIPNVPVSTTYPVSYTLSLPTDTYGGTYSGTLTATIDGETISDSVNIEVNVNEVKSLSITQEPTSITLIRDEVTTGSIVMKIKNNGNVDLENFDVAYSNFVSDTYSLTTNSVDESPSGTTLTVGTEKTITFNLEDQTSSTGQLTFIATVNVTADDVSDIKKVMNVIVRDAVTGVTVGDINAGSSSQERNETLTGSFTVTNSGDIDLTAIQFSDNLASKYNFEITSTLTSLSAGANADVSYSMTVPRNQDSGAETIGAVTFTAYKGATSDTLTDSNSVILTTESNLRINKVEIKAEGESYDKICGDGEYGCDDYDNIQPGKKLYIRVTLENTLESGSDFKMEDVELNAIIESIDGEDEDDLEEDSDKFTISGGKDNDEIITFNLPDPLPDKDTWDVTITAEGEEKESGALHKLPNDITFRIEYDREDDDVRIKEAYFIKDTLTCDRETNLVVTIQNYGKDAPDEARIVIYSNALKGYGPFDSSYGVNRMEDEIELESDPYDDDNEYTARYKIVVPDNYNGDSADVTVWAFHGDSDNDKADLEEYYRQDMTLNIRSCPSNIDTTTRRYIPTTTTSQPVIVTFDDSSDSGDDVYYDSSETAFSESPTYIALLVLVNILVLGGVIVLILKTLRN